MQAFDNGHDLVRLAYPKVPGQINKDVVAVKNENQYRSKFAAFDPAKPDSNVHGHSIPWSTKNRRGRPALESPGPGRLPTRSLLFLHP